MAKNTGQQMRLNDLDLSLIKNTFADNDELLKLMRKIFLPELDPNTPIGQLIDVHMSTPTEDKTDAEIALNVKARNMLIGHVELQLQVLKALAGNKNETVEQTKDRLSKDSSK